VEVERRVVVRVVARVALGGCEVGGSRKEVTGGKDRKERVTYYTLEYTGTGLVVHAIWFPLLPENAIAGTPPVLAA
jgi:hypothetical protein